MRLSYKQAAKALLAIVTCLLMAEPQSALAQIRSTQSEEATCKDIGFRPKTVAYADCVMELLKRQDGNTHDASARSSQVNAAGSIDQSCGNFGTVAYADCMSELPSRRASSKQVSRVSTNRAQPSAPRPEPAALTPHEQTCASYGFKRTTTAFSNCLLELDRAKAQAQYAQQAYQMQVQQYQQQVAAYNAQQEAIRKERERQKWAAIGRLGAGMANSTSPSFLGALNEGLAAANGIPIARPAPLAPEPPTFQNYTIRLPSGNQVYCNYNSLSGYMNCR